MKLSNLISNIQYGRRPPFWKSLYLRILAANRPIARNLVGRDKFWPRRWKRDKIQKFANSEWWMDATLKITLWLQLSCMLSHWDEIWSEEAESQAYEGQVIKCLITGGRQHFENRYTSISEPRIVQIWWNLVCKCKFWHSRGNVTNINLKSV